MTSNRRRRSRYTPPSNRHRPHPGDDNPPPLYVIGWYDPDGNEIETIIDLNDPTADQTLVDLIHLMTDNCPHCNGHHQEDDHHGRD